MEQTYLTSPACVRKLARTWNKMPGFVVFCPSGPSTGTLIKGHNTAALARFTSGGALHPLAASLNASWTRRSVFGVSGQEGLMIACWVKVGLGKVEYARRGTNDMVGDEREKRNAILLRPYGKERGRFIAQGPAHYINSTISLTTNTAQYDFCVPCQLVSSLYPISCRWQWRGLWWRPSRCRCRRRCSRVGKRDDRLLLWCAIGMRLDFVDLAFRFLPGFQILWRSFKLGT